VFSLVISGAWMMARSLLYQNPGGFDEPNEAMDDEHD
jgi:hypothetical protein